MPLPGRVIDAAIITVIADYASHTLPR